MDTYFTVVTYVMAGLFGICVGSFLNVVIYRVPEGMSLAEPPSHCPQCGYQLKWYDNIPVLSYFVLGGKCRSCKSHIPFRYTAVEIGNMVLWLGCVWAFWKDAPVYACIAMAACSVALCVAFIDLEHLIIYDRFQLMLLALGVAAVFFDGSKPWWSHVIGGLGGFAAFWLFAGLGEKMFGQEALGGGDVKLVGCMGLLLGWEKLLLAVLLASVSASVLLVCLRHARGDEKQREYPLGPFLAAGMLAAMLFGEQIIGWYVGLLMH